MSNDSKIIHHRTILGFTVEEKRREEARIPKVMSRHVCVDSFYAALCTCIKCKYTHDYIYINTLYSKADVLKLREVYKEYRMSQP
jgi:hypothetical protein